MSNDFGEFLDNEGGAIIDESTLINKVFLWMFGGILVSAITSLITVKSPTMLSLVVGNPIIFFVLAIAEIALVLILSRSARSLSYQTAIVAFIAYAIINGLTLSVIFLIYELSSIVNILFLTAGMFGIMAFAGYTLKVDLSRIGNVLLIGLICLIVGSIINLFIASNTFDLVLSAVGVLIFLLYTAYDIQRIKNASQYATDNQMNNIAIVFALELYLDFVNLFLKLLRLFGRRRR